MNEHRQTSPAASNGGSIRQKQARMALVHDWLNQDGGAEVVMDVLHDFYPQAPVYTSIADATRVPAQRAWDVRSSWMDRLPGIHAHHQVYLPLYPLAWSRRKVLWL